MTLQPLGHRVLIDPVIDDGLEENETLSKLGFELQGESVEMMRAATQIGRIVAIGSTAWKDQGLGGIPWAEVGDVVYFAKYAHKVVKDGDKEYFIVNDEDCQCKIDDRPEFLPKED
jgi:co-chaperonin GroES (HSP10)